MRQIPPATQAPDFVQSSEMVAALGNWLLSSEQLVSPLIIIKCFTSFATCQIWYVLAKILISAQQLFEAPFFLHTFIC